MKNDIQLNQKQELKMNPEMLQSIRILQMNSAELSEYIEQEILQNPVLESSKSSEGEISSEDFESTADGDDVDRFEAYDQFEYGRNVLGATGTADYEKFVRKEETLQEHLLQQLGSIYVSPGIARICEYLIGNLDEDGYLFLTEQEFCEDTGAGIQEMNQALSIIQEMDPAGVGARSLQECLQLQLEAVNRWTPLMEKLIGENLEDIAANRISRIASKLGVKKAEAEKMVRLIRCLEPKPGCRFVDNQGVPYVTPDVVVERMGEQIRIGMNDSGIQSIRYSPYYSELYRESNASVEVRKYLSKQFVSADVLMENIRQRNETLLRVAEAIVKHQKEFFEPGIRMLRPLTMLEISEELNMHVSTVSRAVSGKYIQCENHIFPLKHFFGSGVSVRNTEDDMKSSGISGTTIRRIMRELIQEEDPAHPLSDQKIANLLMDRGIQISRRTVTKYREKDGIETASRRKR